MPGDILGNRKKSEEARFKMHRELTFKAHSRRNKLLALWAAEKMGFDPAQTEAYVVDVVMNGLEVSPAERIFADFVARDIPIEMEQVAAKMQSLQEEAFRQLESDFPQALGSDH